MTIPRGPVLPASLLHDMVRIVPGGSYSGKGKQWVPDLDPEKETFKGVVMPLSNEDLQRSDAGNFTKNTKKLYTNGATVAVGAQFTDTFDDKTYTVVQELEHGPIHTLKRYAVEAEGRASSK